MNVVIKMNERYGLLEEGKKIPRLELIGNDYENLNLLNICDRLNERQGINCEPIKAPYRINLMNDCMIPKEFGYKYDDFDFRNKTEWYAQEQLDALKFYTYFDGYGIVATGRNGGYQGEYYAIIEHKDFIFLWRDWFGSCSGCDGLDGLNDKQGYEYIKQTLSEGNTLQFWSLKQAKSYVKEIKSDRFNYWEDFPMKMFNEAEDMMW